MTGIKRVTIFGGDGFIGRHLVQRLAARGATIIVYARHARDAVHLKPMGNPGQIVLANGDIRDTGRVAAAIAGSDAVVNLVGILRERGSQQFMSLQRDAAALLAKQAAAAGVGRLIHLSAIGADAASPSLYARSKAEGEAAISASFPDATILRPSIVFGAEDQFFNRFAAMAMLSPVLPIVGAATRFQPVYVGDVAAAIIAALDNPASRGKTYELGGPEILSFRALLDLMLAEIGIRRLVVDLPPAVASQVARMTAFLPEPPITVDQILLLQRDNVVSPGTLTLATLGIAPTPVRQVLPDQLKRFRSMRKAPLKIAG
jgi:uncharacterized protein YbjT (DUF2867 family)